MPRFVRIGRSGYLLSVATYIIDVNAHCWPFIKTPPYIRSTPLEDFIPPCSRRARALFPRSSRSLSTLLRILLLLLLLLLLLPLLLLANPLYAFHSISSFAGQVIRFCGGNAHHHLSTLSPRSSSSLSFLMPAPPSTTSPPFLELISSRELTHASSFRPGASGRSLFLFLTFLPRVNPLFPRSLDLLLLLHLHLLLLLLRFPRRPGTTSSPL